MKTFNTTLISSELAIFCCVSLIVPPISLTPCFAKAPNEIGTIPGSPVISDTPGVSSWTDYRGPEFEGYANIGKQASLKFWAGTLQKQRHIQMDSVAYIDLKRLWRARFDKSKELKGASTIDRYSCPIGWPDIDVVLAEGSSELKTATYLEAQELADVYVDFRVATEQSPQERTTDYFDGCRLRLVNLVGEKAVTELEASWCTEKPALDRKKPGETNRNSLKQ